MQQENQFKSKHFIDELLSFKEIKEISSIQEEWLQYETDDGRTLWEDLSIWTLNSNLEFYLTEWDNLWPNDSTGRKEITSAQQKISTLIDNTEKLNRKKSIINSLKTFNHQVETELGVVNLTFVKPNLEILNEYTFGTPLLIQQFHDDLGSPLTDDTILIFEQTTWEKTLSNWENKEHSDGQQDWLNIVYPYPPSKNCIFGSLSSDSEIFLLNDANLKKSVLYPCSTEYQKKLKNLTSKVRSSFKNSTPNPKIMLDK